ncbi:hypothetical protein [Nitrosomonas sp. Nm166]|uniref:hypothetical protein n=1 Tax=Nitrosomonas sp. Nm166 TaxID=1881054 RepID=UPI0008E74491|nr:hypothetical protein [Nitrosomonas sp. Nm166]SFE54261.1 hypothetical protein SAMN05428977_10202 [Nitrosomonas sp. Nm166]
MKFSILKHSVVTVFSALMMSQAGVASADNQGGSFTTGLAAAVDFYQVTCFDDGNGAPSYLEEQVKDMSANTPKTSILIYKGTSCTTNKCAQPSTDTTDNNTTYSPLVRVTQGAGSYDVLVHCKASGNVHTGTSITSR